MYLVKGTHNDYFKLQNNIKTVKIYIVINVHVLHHSHFDMFYGELKDRHTTKDANTFL